MNTLVNKVLDFQRELHIWTSLFVFRMESILSYMNKRPVDLPPANAAGRLKAAYSNKNTKTSYIIFATKPWKITARMRRNFNMFYWTAPLCFISSKYITIEFQCRHCLQDNHHLQFMSEKAFFGSKGCTFLLASLVPFVLYITRLQYCSLSHLQKH